MLSRDDYLARVADKMFAGGNVDRRLGDVALCLPTEEDMARLREGMEAFLLDPEEGRDGLLLIADVSEARELLARDGFNINNWHYDRTAAAVLVNMSRGRHEALCAALYSAYAPDAAAMPREECADRFIDAGLGWFRSTASIGRLLIGQDVRMSAQERLVFGQFELQRA